jgi:hypothetical protein
VAMVRVCEDEEKMTMTVIDEEVVVRVVSEH